MRFEWISSPEKHIINQRPLLILVYKFCATFIIFTVFNVLFHVSKGTMFFFFSFSVRKTTTKTPKTNRFHRAASTGGGDAKVEVVLLEGAEALERNEEVEMEVFDLRQAG